MRAVAHAHQDGADLEPAALHLEDVAHARGRIRMRENQNVRGPLHAVRRQDARAQVRIEGRVDVHLTLVAEIMPGQVQQFDCATQAATGPLALVAEL